MPGWLRGGHGSSGCVVADGPDCTCGGPVPAGRRDGFCSSWCAGRDAQGLPPASPPPRFASSSVSGPDPARDGSAASSAPGPAAVTVAPVGDDDEPRRPRYRLRRRPIADEVEGRLREAGLLEHWQAAAVLDLADALDWTTVGGSARAALHRELARQMGELLRGQDEAGSGLGRMRDEVAERRARRQQRAGGA
jgi:hypothetical protein